MINTFIHLHNYLKNHTQFQNNMGKVYIHFQTKSTQLLYFFAQ